MWMARGRELRRSLRRVSSRENSIVAAVDECLALSNGQRTISEAAQAWAAANGRSMTIEDAPLSPGVFGQWLSFPDRDLVQIGHGIVGRDRTIAHELGHMVLGHRGVPVTEYAAEHVQAVPPELVARMLQRSCGGGHAAGEHGDLWSDDELAAERFAGLLVRRLGAGRSGPSRWSPYLDDALG
ncbi:hypothetical protein [Mycobacteroides saopaulense]|uniref:hypothetical protein n=1 Tax=Mycobacteroides saopaulense TaxID=1578165 RepID=UPI00389925C0